MASTGQDPAEKAAENEAKMRLSDDGMAMDDEDIPHGGEVDARGRDGLTPAHHDG